MASKAGPDGCVGGDHGSFQPLHTSGANWAYHLQQTGVRAADLAQSMPDLGNNINKINIMLLIFILLLFIKLMKNR